MLPFLNSRIFRLLTIGGLVIVSGFGLFIYGTTLTPTIELVSISLFISFASSRGRRIEKMLAVSQEWKKGNLVARMPLDQGKEDAP
jgi:HAMP domain-containing protein